jgi:hypothetical protein
MVAQVAARATVFLSFPLGFLACADRPAALGDELLTAARAFEMLRRGRSPNLEHKKAAHGRQLKSRMDSTLQAGRTYAKLLPIQDSRLSLPNTYQRSLYLLLCFDSGTKVRRSLW